jgi:ABC-type nitrate/sulfonate/bicarbonate transport system, ATPase component
MSQVDIQNLSFSYGDTLILDKLTLSIEAGECLVLLGPSGSGKSTLLRLLAGLEAANSGHIAHKGQPVTGASRDRSVVFQDYSLFPWLNLLENVRLAVNKAHPSLNRRQQKDKARALLDEVGLTDALHQYPFEVSGGMQQRAAIARALALEASLLLLDEPFGALDPVNRIRLQDLLNQVRQQQGKVFSTVFVTHDLDEALWLGDRIAVMGASPGHLISVHSVPKKKERTDRDHYRHLVEVQALRLQIDEALASDVLRRLKVEEVSSNVST